MTYDHYPWDDATWDALADDARFALLREIASMLAIPPPVLPPSPPAQRFVKRGSSMICTTCDLDVRYCKGHAGPALDVGSTDGAAESDLERRARECMGR